MSELDEAIEALEAALAYIEESPCDQDITADQWKAWERLKASNAGYALATLRAMKARAVEVRTATSDRGCSCAAARSWDVHVDCGHGGLAWPRALLIPEDQP